MARSLSTQSSCLPSQGPGEGEDDGRNKENYKPQHAVRNLAPGKRTSVW